MSGNRKKGCMVLIIGLLIMGISLLLPKGQGKIYENYQIKRNEFGEGELNISLIAISEQGENTIDYTVSERKYTQSEIEEMLPEFLEQLLAVVVGTNRAQDKINDSLNLAESIDGYPFLISWSSDRSDLVGSEGKIKEEIKVDTPVVLTAEIEYEDWIYEHSFPVVLVPREYTPLEEWTHMLEDALAVADATGGEKEYVTLPREINGNFIEWSEKKSNKGIQIGGFCVVIAFLFFCSDSIEQRELEKKRLQQIRRAYPEFVLKCAMLIGAGMTIRQTFERLGTAYGNQSVKRNPLYEEILVGIRAMENGIAERKVYENFGRRCGIRETEKLGNMLARNLKKGSQGLKSALREEAKEAIEMQKEQIRKQGETAGTKLLFPMLILLLIVMVIIMIPAFSTFSI
ncbi:MAG: type II secretion system F family protein [Lachnospiraceae bacterium]|nr:type II secretion system F family protein [Lachnospiraceae bacterium]